MDTTEVDNDEIQRRLAKLSPYKQAEYHCVECIATLRTSLREVLALEDGTNNNTTNNKVNVIKAELAKRRQAARRAHQRLDKLAREAQRVARRDGGCEADVRELMRHVESARRWYRECFRVVPQHEDEGINNFQEEEEEYDKRGKSTDMTAPLLSSHGGSASSNIGAGNSNRVSAPVPTVGDDEFLLFADQVRQNDDLADAALDRISQGLSRLHETAVNVTSELHAQQQMLDGMGGKVDGTRARLSRLNTRLRKLLAEKNKCDFAMYVVCCLLLLGVIAAIALLLKGL